MVFSCRLYPQKLLRANDPQRQEVTAVSGVYREMLVMGGGGWGVRLETFAQLKNEYCDSYFYWFTVKHVETEYLL